MQKLSIVIPTLNEADSLRRTIENINNPRPEIIVVDGGSSDETADIARSLGVKLIHSLPGRARQMNKGADSASGDTLLFLHADTLLPVLFRNEIQETLSLPGIVIGAFRLRINNQSRSFRLIEKMVNFRSQKFQLPYGDQAFFMKKETFSEVKGFPNLPIMEDFELVRRLKKIGSVGLTRESVVTSDRRWKRTGIWRTTLINQFLIIGYLVGVPPEKLAERYRH